MTGDLDAMGLGQQHPEELLGEVGIDPRLDRLLPAGHDDVAHASGLDDRRIGVLLFGGDLAADGKAFGDDRDQRGIEVIDAGSEVIEIGHRMHRNRSTVRRAL